MSTPRASLDDLALLVDIVRSGNFLRASQHMGISGATLSRRLQAMERRLGLRLFERNNRQVIPTEAAQSIFERCVTVVDEAQGIHASLIEQAHAPRGHVRVSMPVDLGVLLLGTGLSGFLALHPGVTLDLDLSPRFSNLRSDPFDVVFRLGSGDDEGLVAQRIGTVAQGLFAAPDYLARRGKPKRLIELEQHTCLHIGSSRRGASWRFPSAQGERSVQVRGPVGLNNMGLCVQLAESGLGIALLPQHLARPSVEAGRLVPVLPSLKTEGWPLFAMSTSRLRSAAVRALIAFVAAQLATAEREPSALAKSTPAHPHP